MPSPNPNEETREEPMNAETRDEPYVANFRATELRVHEPDEDDGMPTIEGVAVKWGSLSEDLGGYRERFVRGAFRETLENDDTRVVWQHDTSMVFGRVRAGTAEIWEDDDGLRFRAEPPDAVWARDAIASIRRGDVDQNSFRFHLPNPNTDQTFTRENGTLVREVSRATLVEVGPQTTPAYLDTKVAVRCLEEARERGLLEEDEDGEAEGPSAETLRRKREADKRKRRLAAMGVDVER